jgi:hypothetical protein
MSTDGQRQNPMLQGIYTTVIDLFAFLLPKPFFFVCILGVHLQRLDARWETLEALVLYILYMAVIIQSQTCSVFPHRCRKCCQLTAEHEVVR